MSDQKKTKEQLVSELVEMRRQVAELKASETERKRAEDALRESEATWRSLVESVPDFIVTVDRDGTILFVNRTLPGLPSREQTIGTNIYDFTPPAVHETVRQLIEGVFRTGEIGIYEGAGTGPNGGTAYYRAHVGPIKQEGQVVAAVLIADDIIDQKRAEDALRDSEEELSTIFDNAPIGMFLLDPERRIRKANRALTQFAGRSAEEIGGLRPGEALGCLHSLDDPEGCGFGPSCKTCTVRNTVLDTFETGKSHHRVEAKLVFDMGDELEEWALLVSTGVLDVRGEQMVLVCTEDITERKRAEKELRLTQFSIDHAGDAAFWMGQDARFIYVNEAACRSLGYSREELLAMSVHDMDPDFPEEAWPQHWCEIRERASFTFESHHCRKDGHVFPVEVAVNYLEHDGGQYSCAFARDITERKRAEEALKESEEKYRTLFDTSPDGIAIATLEGVILDANQSYQDMLGYTKEELKGMSYHTLTPSKWQEVEAENIDTIMLRNGLGTLEKEYVRKDGTVFPISLTGWVIRDAQGNPARLGAFVKDITERKRAEEALRESEDRFSTAFHSSPALMAITRMADGCIVNINDSFASALGYSREEVIGRSTVEMGIWGSPEDRSVFTQAIERHGWVRDFDIAVHTQSGETRFGILSAEVINLNGESHLITVAIDITERKRAEESLTETNQLLETILNSTHMLVAYMDTEFNFLGVNQAYARADERETAFFPGKNHFDLYPNAENEEIFRCTVETGEPYFAYAKPFEYAEHPERGVTYWDWSLIPIQEPKGTVSGLVMTLVNVTDRHRAEDLVAAQRDLAVALNAAVDLDEGLRLCVETALDISGTDCGGVYLVDESSGALDLAFSQGLCPGFAGNVAHFGPDTRNARLVTAGAPVYSGYPELGVPLGRAERREGLRAIAVIPIQYEGRVIACLNVASHARDQVPAYARVALENIAAQIGSAIARLRTGRELRESEEKYRELVENVNDVIYSIGRNGVVTYISPAIQSITGYAPSELLGRPFSGFVYEEALPVMRERFEKLLAGNVVAGEYRILHKSGEARWILTSSKPILDGDRVVGVQGMLTDITERKRAEEALRESEERLRGILSSLHEAIILVYDRDGHYVSFWGPLDLEQRYGISAEDFEGKLVTDVELLPTELATKRLGDIRHMVETGEPLRDEYPLQLPGGKFWFDVSLCPMRGTSGQVTGVVAFIRDITERKSAERELERSRQELRDLSTHLQFVREEERAHIARAIHDELGQSLTALKMDLSWLGRKFPKDETVSEKVRSMSALIDTTIQEVRRISTELRPGLLDDLGLIAAIEWQIENFEDRAGLKCKFMSDQRDAMFGKEVSTAIFRILQEALTNVARHAAATSVEVSLSKKHGMLLLDVRDDGRGITSEQIADPAGYGILGMRERALHLGGRLGIAGTPGRGTVVTVNIPLEGGGETKS